MSPAHDNDVPQTSHSLELPPGPSQLGKDAEMQDARPLPPEEIVRDLAPVLLRECLTEWHEYVRTAEVSLLTLEVDPDDHEAIHTIFRAFHNLKGTAAFLGLHPLTELAHGAETFVSRMRTGAIRCMGGYAELALQAIDMCKTLLCAVQETAQGAPWCLPEGWHALLHALTHPEAVGVSATAPHPPPLRLGDLLVAANTVSREHLETIAATQGDQPLGVALLRAGAASLPDIVRALRRQQRLLGVEQTVESAARVPTQQLAQMEALAETLVATYDQVIQDPAWAHVASSTLVQRVLALRPLLETLHTLTSAMRMVPLATVFHKLHRVVREAAKQSGKRAQLLIEGADLTVERAASDLLYPALVQLVRNAVDHGIEAPHVRAQQGKSPLGLLWLRALQVEGHVRLTLHDDGQGMDRAKMRAQACRQGLVPAPGEFTDTDILRLILSPGFSTATQVTDLSGRGVGMDIVAQSLARLGGRLELVSAAGEGTTFVLTIPAPSAQL